MKKFITIILIFLSVDAYSQEIGSFWTGRWSNGLINIIWTVHGDEKDVQAYLIRKNGHVVHRITPTGAQLSSGYQVLDKPTSIKRVEYSLVILYKSGFGVLKAKSKYPYY